MARRTQALFIPDVRSWLDMALAGAFLLFTGLVTLFVQLWVSVRDRAANRVFAGDPWAARSLAWSTSAPPPEHNFATIPMPAAATPSTGARSITAPTSRPTIVATSTCSEQPRRAAVGLAGAICASGLVWQLIVYALALVRIVVHLSIPST